MGFWKEVNYEMSLGKSKERAIQDTIKYYQKYKPSYFKNNEKKQIQTNNLLQVKTAKLAYEMQKNILTSIKNGMETHI